MSKYKLRLYYYVIFSIPYAFNRQEYECKCPDSVSNKKDALRYFEKTSDFKIDGVLIHNVKTREY